jgi:hypothetical protein
LIGRRRTDLWRAIVTLIDLSAIHAYIDRANVACDGI